MELIHSLDNSTFVFQNVLDNLNIFDNIIDECDLAEKNGDFVVRIEILNKKTDKQIGFAKPYKELSDSEKFLFDNIDYIRNDNINTPRLDFDINLSQKIKTTLDKNIKECLNLIYKNEVSIDDIYSDYNSVIKYGNGYKMARHNDGGPNNRFCTAVLYCNTMLPEYIGGNTIFYKNNEEIFNYKPRINDLIIFDSYYNLDTLEHEVIEIKNWERYVYRVYFKKNKL